MKSFLAFLILLPSAFAFSAVTCPQGSKKLETCLSTPMKGDSEVASKMFDSITFCDSKGKTIMVFEAGGDSEAIPADVVTRMGGTTYSVHTRYADFSFNRVTGILPGLTRKGQFIIEMKEAAVPRAVSTFTCQK